MEVIFARQQTSAIKRCPCGSLIPNVGTVFSSTPGSSESSPHSATANPRLTSALARSGRIGSTSASANSAALRKPSGESKSVTLSAYAALTATVSHGHMERRGPDLPRWRNCDPPIRCSVWYALENRADYGEITVVYGSRTVLVWFVWMNSISGRISIACMILC